MTAWGLRCAEVCGEPNVNKVMGAAAHDIVLAEAFMRVIQLLDAPAKLLRPSLSIRVVTGNRRRVRARDRVAADRI